MNPSQTRPLCLSEQQIRWILQEAELKPDLLDQIELHLSACELCRARLERALDDTNEVTAATIEMHVGTDLAGNDERQPDDKRPKYDAQTTKNLELPRRFGKYELLEVIASGGMGCVYKARQIELNRLCALKQILAGTDADQEQIERFQREAQAAARLRHNGIVKVFDVGAFEGKHFIEMELVEGSDLREVASARPLSAKRAAGIMAEVADAVQHAHEEAVIHRDIKPANVLLGQDGAPRLVDFGLAKDIDHDPGVTREGTIMGTISFMAPEQTLPNAKNIGPPCDVYALGAVLYYLLTSKPPFETSDPWQTIEQIRNSEPVSPRRLNPAIDRDIETVCLKCLRKDPAGRYESAGDMRDDLKRYLAGMPIKARPINIVSRACRWSKRHPASAALLALASIVILALAIGSPIIAARELKLGRLANEKRLAQEREAHAKTLAEERERITESWTLRTLQNEAAKRSKLEIVGRNSAPVTSHVPQHLRSIDTELLSRFFHDRVMDSQFWVHGDRQILDVAYSEDRRQLATLDASGLVNVWDTQSGKQKKQLTNPPWNAEYNIYHHFLGFLLKHKTDGQAIPNFPFCSSIVWARDERSIVGATLDGKVVTFPLQGDDQQTLFELGDSLHSLAWNDTQTRLVTGGKSGKLYLLNIAADGKKTLKIGDSSINLVRPLPDGDLVVVGTRDGKVAIVDTTAAEIVAKIELKRRVWDLLPAGVLNGKQQIYVASPGNRIRLLEFSLADKQLSASEQGTIAIDDEILSAIHSLDLDGQDRLLALDDTNRVWAVSLEERGAVQFITPVLARNDQRNALLAKLHDEKIAVPDPFDRVGLVRSLPDAKAGFAVAGINSAVGIYQLAEKTTRPYFRLLKTNVGGAATIVFDDREKYLLWVLRRDGQLALVDVMSDKEIARLQAHQGESFAIVSLRNEGTVATAGGDGLIRVWKQAKGKIVEVKQVSFEKHDHGLLSLAYDPNQKRLAAVDERANLLIWDASSGKEYAKLALNENPTRPFTGKLAFNCDGTRLVAFGAEQSAHVFKFDPPQRLPEQPNMASLGGSAVCWSPTHSQKFIVADYYSSKAFQYGDRLNVFHEGLHHQSTRSSCVAAKGTSDDRRVVLLEKNGLIRFFDTEAMIPVFDFRSTLLDCVDLSFSKSNDLFAVVDELGELEIIDVLSQRPRKIEERWRVMERQPWTKVRLFDSEHRLLTAEKAICFDTREKIHLLVVENRVFAGPAKEPADFRSYGALHYIREDDAETVFAEQIRVDETINDRQIDSRTLDLELTNEDRPVAVLRRNIPSPESNYTGDSLLAKRGKDEKWRFETIVKTANMGFFPLIDMDEAGNVRAVFHDSQATYNLYRSTPGEEGKGQWDHQVIGLHGDGLYMQGIRYLDSVRFISTRYRFIGDMGLTFIGTWQDDKLQRFELGTNITDCRLRDDGRSFALSEETRNKKLSATLVQWNEDQWTLARKLPEDFRIGLQDYRIDRQGHILALYWDEAVKQLWFIRDIGAEFQAERVMVEEHPSGYPLIFRLLLDAADRPVVIATTSAEKNGYVEIYRRPDR